MAERNSGSAGLPGLAELPRVFAAAPHRMLFFAGAAAVLVSMTWWAFVLGAGRFGFTVPAPPVPRPPGRTRCWRNTACWRPSFSVSC